MCYVFVGPPITSTLEVDGKSLLVKDNRSHPGNEMATGPFTMKSPPMTTYNQQLWLIGKLATNNNDGKSMLVLEVYFCFCYGVTRSKKIGSDGDIRKTRNVFKNLRFCGKKKDCTRQLTSTLKL